MLYGRKTWLMPFRSSGKGASQPFVALNKREQKFIPVSLMYSPGEQSLRSLVVTADSSGPKVLPSKSAPK